MDKDEEQQKRALGEKEEEKERRRKEGKKEGPKREKYCQTSLFFRVILDVSPHTDISVDT